MKQISSVYREVSGTAERLQVVYLLDLYTVSATKVAAGEQAQGTVTLKL